MYSGGNSVGYKAILNLLKIKSIHWSLCKLARKKSKFTDEQLDLFLMLALLYSPEKLQLSLLKLCRPLSDAGQSFIRDMEEIRRCENFNGLYQLLIHHYGADAAEMSHLLRSYILDFYSNYEDEIDHEDSLVLKSFIGLGESSLIECDEEIFKFILAIETDKRFSRFIHFGDFDLRKFVDVLLAVGEFSFIKDSFYIDRDLTPAHYSTKRKLNRTTVYNL